MTRRKEVTADETVVALLDELSESGEDIVLTKDGRVVGTLTRPPRSLRGSVLWEGDIVSPIDAEWTYDKENFKAE
jgi:hypothetical protein